MEIRAAKDFPSPRTGLGKSPCELYKPSLHLGSPRARTSLAEPRLLRLVSSPDPTHNGKGSGDIRAFFLVVLCQQNARDYIQYSTSYAICVPCGCHMTADTAQPRKRSNVTRPFPICGMVNVWPLGEGRGSPQRSRGSGSPLS